MKTISLAKQAEIIKRNREVIDGDIPGKQSSKRTRNHDTRLCFQVLEGVRSVLRERFEVYYSKHENAYFPIYEKHRFEIEIFQETNVLRDFIRKTKTNQETLNLIITIPSNSRDLWIDIHFALSEKISYNLHLKKIFSFFADLQESKIQIIINCSDFGQTQVFYEIVKIIFYKICFHGLSFEGVEVFL